MIHLSVAIGRFFEALFFAILKVAGAIAGSVVGIALVGAILFWVARMLIVRGKR
ncbi:hypothetical protein [Sphingomonas adhaesiva]|uniref:hypothetical protein n=1 Tax=Sphingomonas adhaesiva TaxID=28212 RepID=UPI002FF9782F